MTQARTADGGTAYAQLDFHFEGGLDEVTTDAAATLARMVRGLLQHGDECHGTAAKMRTARLGSALNLWLTDPVCSPACLCGSGHLPSTAAPGDVRMVLDPHPEGGLRLHWALALTPQTQHTEQPTTTQD